MWITRVAIDNPVFASMVMLAITVLGMFSYQYLPVEQFPSIEFPIITITTQYLGASPEIVERNLTEPIESVVNTIGGIQRVTSYSYQGLSIVVVELELSQSAVEGAQNIREKLSIIRSALPEGITEPAVLRLDPTATPILSLSLTSETVDSHQLTRLAADRVQQILQRVAGVGDVEIIGGVNKALMVELDLNLLMMHNITPTDVIRAIKAQTGKRVIGSLTQGHRELVVHLDDNLKEVIHYQNLVVTQRDNYVIRLKDIAHVDFMYQDRINMALFDGKPGIAINIIAVQGANILEIVDSIKKALVVVRKALPDTVKVQVVRDASLKVRSSMDNLQSTLLEGAILTVLIVFLFLGSWRSTVITGLTLPITIIGSFFIIHILGFSLNSMTLLALSLSVGLLIDDAIVVRENIVRHLAKGMDHREAALLGTDEIALAVLATTFTIVAVFLPMGFMGGIIGLFFKQFGLTVSLIVLLSMFISFTLDPMLSAIWPDPAIVIEGPGKERVPGVTGWILHGVNQVQHSLEEAYVVGLRWSLNNRLLVILLGISSCVLAVFLMQYVSKELVPPSDYNELLIQVKTPPGSSLDFTTRKAQLITDIISDYPEILHSYATINAGQASNVSEIFIFATLTSRTHRQRDITELASIVRKRLHDIPGLMIEKVGVLSETGFSKPVSMDIIGPDLHITRQLASQFIKDLSYKVPELVDIASTSDSWQPKVLLKLNRDRAADFGVTLDNLTALLNPMFQSIVVTTQYQEEGNLSYTVVVSSPSSEKIYQSLMDMQVPVLRDNMPGWVALREVVDIHEELSADNIVRVNMNYAIVVSADLAPNTSLGDATAKMSKVVEESNLPFGYSITYSGEAEKMYDSFSYVGQSLLMTVIFIYMILASQFRSFIHPVTIMCSLPLSFLGVIGALLIFNQTFNLFSIIGVIMLMGLVTKNAILLIDFINRSVWEGMNRTQAILLAGQVRLRPILMTTISMIAGMMPLVLSSTEGSETRAPMAYAVIGGLMFSSLLTLIVVPVIYTYFDDIRRLFIGLEKDS